VSTTDEAELAEQETINQMFHTSLSFTQLIDCNFSLQLTLAVKTNMQQLSVPHRFAFQVSESQRRSKTHFGSGKLEERRVRSIDTLRNNVDVFFPT
jgi:hypothetical protein